MAARVRLFSQRGLFTAAGRVFALRFILNGLIIIIINDTGHIV